MKIKNGSRLSHKYGDLAGAIASLPSLSAVLCPASHPPRSLARSLSLTHSLLILLLLEEDLLTGKGRVEEGRNDVAGGERGRSEWENEKKERRKKTLKMW